MSQDKERELASAHFGSPFQSLRRRDMPVNKDMVFMHAAEYSAAQLGLLNEKLERLIAAVEKLAAKP